jgi:hypothetical protein
MMLAPLMVIALASEAMAQGTIYYYNVGGDTYSVGGDGANPRLVMPGLANANGRPSGLTYGAAGRLFFAAEDVGTIPGTELMYRTLIARGQDGSRFLLADFSGPLYLKAGNPRWSNDHNDTFFSFLAYDPRTDLVYAYRVRATGAQIASGGFVPVSMADLDDSFVPLDPSRWSSFW